MSSTPDNVKHISVHIDVDVKKKLIDEYEEAKQTILYHFSQEFESMKSWTQEQTHVNTSLSIEVDEFIRNNKNWKQMLEDWVESMYKLAKENMLHCCVYNYPLNIFYKSGIKHIEIVMRLTGNKNV